MTARWTIQSGAGFDDLGMIVGADADAHGEVTIDAAFGFIVAQSGSGAATDGVLIVGEDGDGTVDVTDTSVFGSAITILGENDGSTGEVDLNNSIWGGSSLTIGPAGTGIANIGSGSTVTHAPISSSDRMACSMQPELPPRPASLLRPFSRWASARSMSPAVARYRSVLWPAPSERSASPAPV